MRNNEFLIRNTHQILIGWFIYTINSVCLPLVMLTNPANSAYCWMPRVTLNTTIHFLGPLLFINPYQIILHLHLCSWQANESSAKAETCNESIMLSKVCFLWTKVIQYSQRYKNMYYFGFHRVSAACVKYETTWEIYSEVLQDFLRLMNISKLSLCMHVWLGFPIYFDKGEGTAKRAEQNTMKRKHFKTTCAAYLHTVFLMIWTWPTWSLGRWEKGSHCCCYNLLPV